MSISQTMQVGTTSAARPVPTPASAARMPCTQALYSGSISRLAAIFASIDRISFNRRKSWVRRSAISAAARSAGEALVAPAAGRGAAAGTWTAPPSGADATVRVARMRFLLRRARLMGVSCQVEGSEGLERSGRLGAHDDRSEEHTSELQSLMRISYAVFCLKKKTTSNKAIYKYPSTEDK